MQDSRPAYKHNFKFDKEFPCSIETLRDIAPPGHAPNWHDYLEISHVMAGRGSIHVGPRSFPIGQGDIFIIGGKELHWVDPSPDNHVAINCIFFEKEFVVPAQGDIMGAQYIHMYDVIHECNDRIFGKDKPEYGEVIQFMEKLREEHHLQKPDSRLAIQSHLLEVLFLIQRGLGIDPSTKPTRPSLDDRIQKVVAHIRTNYSSSLSRTQLAKIACMSETYLSKFFQKQTGMSVTKFINWVRADEAKKLLLTTSLSANQIAYTVGIESESYFHRMFHSITGMTPMQYRKKN